ncbi:hypothetical protein [Caballeronia sp. LZ001]|uniref:hypothetical protein n=1 Tax=Caballeronia sp. LZ001 TaxID=3038553 RepID=UPI002858A691|nr:hypothetical protein [Caballeronia sp. LZ001]MDR5804905.1 hypothetical protein [Caballeronia sp. LZ001]
MEHTNVAWPVWPDAQELRMLRALVREGVARMAAIQYGVYAVHFRGWRVRVWHDGAFRNTTHVDIRSDAGEVWARFTWKIACPADDEVAR